MSGCFYQSSDEPDADQLKDLANAHVYRTEYKPSCQCQAQSWIEEARQRHAMYVTEE